MSAQFTQENRWLQVSTPLGENELILTNFRGREEMSRLFHFELNFVSTNSEIKPEQIVGKNVTVTVPQADGTPRYFNGYVKSFVYMGTNLRASRYRAEVVPWLWFLTRRADCRIFCNKSIPDILQTIFGECSLSKIDKSQVGGSYPPLEYCVQYRETAFNFVSRLMEQAGIFYYFKHGNGSHTLVLADRKTGYMECAENEASAGESADFVNQTDMITDWQHSYHYISGKYAQTDYNFKTPSANLMVNKQTSVSVQGVGEYEIYDYPGEYDKKGDGDQFGTVRMEEIRADYDVITATSQCVSFSPGGKFKLTHHHSAAEANKSYLLTSVDHHASDADPISGTEESGGRYSNALTCIPSEVIFRPARMTPKPVVNGLQTAVVVGPQGSEIYTDKYGRVKVKFFWDRESKKDEDRTCWMRVAQSWAGRKWGMQFIPRIGHEVIVEFLEGDPDRPLITGCVYNADMMPPYDPESKKTQSGLKTRSTEKGSDANFNELRFEDKKGSEDIYFHAEKDFHRVVENNDDLKVGFETKDKGDQNIEIFNNQQIYVGKGQGQCSDGSQTLTVWKDRTTTIETGHDTLQIKTGNRSTTLDQGNQSTQVKMGNRDVKIDMGNDSLKISMGNQTTKLDLGASSTEAMQSIELKVGQSSIKIDQTGVTIKGMMVKLDGQVQTEVKGLMTQVTGSAMLKAGGGITMIG